MAESACNVSEWVWRRAIITSFNAALAAGDIDSAARCFAEDAQIMVVRYVRGRVAGGEMIALGREAIVAWLAALVDRRARFEVLSMEEEGVNIVVRADWSLDGFHGERATETVVVTYDVGHVGIGRLYAVSRE